MSAPFPSSLPSFGCICHWASLPPLRDKSLRRPSFLPFRSLSAISGKNAATLRRSTDANESVSHVPRSPIRSPSLSPDNFGPKVPSSPFPYEKWALPLLFPLPTFWPTFDRVRPSPLTARASTFIFFLAHTVSGRSCHCWPLGLYYMGIECFGLNWPSFTE